MDSAFIRLRNWIERTRADIEAWLICGCSTRESMKLNLSQNERSKPVEAAVMVVLGNGAFKELEVDMESKEYRRTCRAFSDSD